MNGNVRGGSASLEPRDDMEFDSNEAAYEFYKEYAKSMGFGTAKLSSRRSRASKEFIDAKFSCIRYGNKQQSDDAINPRPSPKIGCKASMHVKRRPDGKWFVYSFVKEHNHELLPEQSHFFRSHWVVDQIKNDPKIRRRKITDVVSKQYGEYQYSDSLESYHMRNQHYKGRSLTLEEGDAQLLLEFFANMQDENPKFFYAIDFNEEHRLRNVFWIDAKGLDDYKHFGDVVSFETSYVVNKYKIPLVLFIGVNHHIQPTLLGCALIADETIYTYIWLMHTWCISGGGRPPRVLLTDLSNPLKEAISAVFPNTYHSYNLWNVVQRIPRQVDFVNLWHENFMAKFDKCIYKSWTEEQFQKRWWKLLERFNLREDDLMQSFYEDRRMWAPTFMRNMSFAGLSVASRSGSMNAFYDKYINGEMSLTSFIEQYKLTLQDRYEEEAKANFDAWHETPELKSPSPFEKQMSSVYTHEIFKKFQVEVLGASACHLKKEKEDETTKTYLVKDFEADQDFLVEWDEHRLDIYCSCRSFEFNGYICRHAIVVLQMFGIFNIPFKFILQRWTNAATSRHPIGEKLDDLQSSSRRYNDLCRRAIILGEEGSLSEESYNIALNAIKEALKQCRGFSNCNTNESRPNISSIPLTSGADTSQNKTVTPREYGNLGVGKTDKAAKRTKNTNDNSNTNKQRKVSSNLDVTNIGTQVGFQQMELSNARPAQFHELMPSHLQNVMIPPMFHNVVPTRFPSMTTSTVTTSTTQCLKEISILQGDMHEQVKRGAL